MILSDVKEYIGFDESGAALSSDYTAFNGELTIILNSAISIMSRVGVPVHSRVVSGCETWHDIFGDCPVLDLVKEYVCLKCKCVFDPPANSSILSAFQQSLSELEWTINTEIELVHSSLASTHLSEG